VSALAALPPTLLVGIGGACGALARHGVGLALGGRRATLAVNALGSLALGVVAVRADGPTAALVGTGFCGAFTTFSSVAVAVAGDLSDDDARRALAYAAVTLGCAVLGAVLGRAMGGWAGPGAAAWI
jgi:CrcB protein